MNLMETKATSDDKRDTVEETMKEKLLLMPEDNITTEKTKDAVTDKSAAEIANPKEEIEKDRKTEYYHVKKCYRCGSDEHLIRDGNSDNRKWNIYHIPKACHICKKTGHRTTDCWFRDQVDGKRRCFRCGSDSYISQYATIAAPLSNLTKKGCPQKVVWRESQEQAFMTLNKYLTSKPVLRLPDMDKSFILRTDASNSGVGAVLLQEHEGELHPISYASKKLSERETRYSTMERECLALVWAVKKFQVYLYGKNFVLQTDHQPLAYLDRCKVENQRIMRWQCSYRHILSA